MCDSKHLAKTDPEIERFVEIVQICIMDLVMEFSITKYAAIILKRGKGKH